MVENIRNSENWLFDDVGEIVVEKNFCNFEAEIHKTIFQAVKGQNNIFCLLLEAFILLTIFKFAFSFFKKAGRNRKYLTPTPLMYKGRAQNSTLRCQLNK